MDKIVILGAGRIARRIASLLRVRAHCLIVDHDTAKLDLARDGGFAVAPMPPGVGRESLRQALQGAAALIVVDPFLPPRELVSLAVEAGCHYLDLNESDASAREVAEVAATAPAGLHFAPGCGLAPGYVTSLLAEEIARTPETGSITAYVGVLPLTPSNRLGYANIWGVPGLLHEYTRPVLSLREGALHSAAPLEDHETVQVEGLTLEAFTTAGSIDALARGRQGAVRNLAFKTLRYPGHLDYMLFLLDDLGLRHQLHRLSSLLMTALPATEADRVVIALRTVPAPGSRPRWRTWQFLASAETGSAMATLTAAHAVAMLDYLRAAGSGVPAVLMPGDVGLDDLRSSPAFVLLDGAAHQQTVPA